MFFRVYRAYSARKISTVSKRLQAVCSLPGQPVCSRARSLLDPHSPQKQVTVFAPAAAATCIWVTRGQLRRLGVTCADVFDSVRAYA